MVTKTRGLTRDSQFAQAALRKGKQILLERAKAVGVDAVSRVEAIVAADYVTNRPPERRRGDTPLLGSFSSSAEWDGSPGGKVRLTLSSNANEVKVLSLESGSKPHTITARNASRLAFPSTTPRANILSKRQTPKPAKFRPHAFRSEYANPGKVIARPESVDHPGTSAGRFMERALASAVQAAFRASLRRRRR